MSIDRFRDLVIKWNKGIVNGMQTNFAKAIGVSQYSVSRWLKGDVPNERLRLKIAKELGISVDELVSFFSSIPKKRFTKNFIEKTVQYIPVIGIINAENFFMSKDFFVYEVLPITTGGFNCKEVVSFKIAGNFMEPIANSNEYVILCRVDYVYEGKLGIFYSGDEYLIREVHYIGDTVELISICKNKKILRMKRNELKSFGQVIGFFRKG
ncbi:MAG: helix-turn-helix domain-containing protein [Elusimicrobiales bacterium]